MAQVVSLTAEARARFRVDPCGICGGQSGTGTGFSPSSSVFPCQYIKSPKERDHWEDQGVGGKMLSELILGRLAWGVWVGFDWLRTGTDGGLL
jgi:hypothetical protein